MDRVDRVADEPGQDPNVPETVVMDLEMPRQAIPEPSDGEVCTRRLVSALQNSMMPDHMSHWEQKMDMLNEASACAS